LVGSISFNGLLALMMLSVVLGTKPTYSSRVIVIAVVPLGAATANLAWLALQQTAPLQNA
jgi:hypothetical protein